MSSRSRVDRIEAQSWAANLKRELQDHRTWAEKKLARDGVDWRHVVRDVLGTLVLEHANDGIAATETSRGLHGNCDSGKDRR